MRSKPALAALTLAFALGLGSCVSHAPLAASASIPTPERPWIDSADELGPVREAEEMPGERAWLPARALPPDTGGIAVAMDERRRFALVTTVVGIATMFDLQRGTVRARARYGYVSEFDEAGWGLVPRLSRTGGDAVLVEEGGGSSIVRRFDGIGVTVALGGEGAVLDEVSTNAELDRFAWLHRGDAQLTIHARRDGGVIEEHCRVSIAGLKLLSSHMTPSGASVILVRHPADEVLPDRPRGPGLRIDTATCAVSVLEGDDVRFLAARPQGGQFVLVNGDRLEFRSPSDGRLLGTMARDGAIAATYSEDGSRIELRGPDERRTFVSAADGTPVDPFEISSRDDVPEEVSALPRGESLLLLPLRFAEDASLIVETRSDFGSGYRSAIRLHVAGVEDACGPMNDSSSRKAAIRRSLACLPDLGLRALDVSADGSRALVRRLESQGADVAGDGVGPLVDPHDTDAVVGDVFLYDVGEAQIGPRVPRLDSAVYFGEPLGVTAALSPDGSRLVVADSLAEPPSVRLVDASTGRVLASRNADGREGVRFIDRSTVEVLTPDRALVLRADRQLAVARSTYRTSRMGCRWPPAPPSDGFVPRCQGGSLFLERSDGAESARRIGACPSHYARVVIRDDGRVVALSEGDRLLLQRVETGESVALRIQVDGGRRTIAIADSELHVSILEGEADAFRIREAGDVLTAPLRSVVDGPEPRSALARILAP